MREVTEQIARRTARLCDALDDAALPTPSRLPGWNRLTIVCHLRYGADAVAAMVAAARKGDTIAYYPLGREAQREGTLVPSADERPADVVRSLRQGGERLDAAWRDLTDDEWGLVVDEPELGPISLAFLAQLRLSEVEVHGRDLDIGCDDWSDVFVSAALPARLGWLNIRGRRGTGDGTWLLVATDGPTYRVTASGDEVTSAPSADVPHDDDSVIRATSSDLLAMLFGRATAADLGDAAVTFKRAFPGP